MNDVIKRLAVLIVLGLVSAFPLSLLLWSGPRMYPAPENSWLAVTYLILLGAGFGIAAILVVRQVHPTYCVWAQTALSFMIFVAYYGFLRREDRFRHYPDPDALDRIAPAASLSHVLMVVLGASVLGSLPLVLRVLLRWLWRNRNSSADSSKARRV